MADRQLQIREKKRLEKNRHEGYNPLIMILIFLTAPLNFTGRTWFGPSLEELRRDNYKRKHFQRLVLLIAGTLFWIVVISYEIDLSEKRRQEAIDRIDEKEVPKERERYYGKGSAAGQQKAQDTVALQ